MVTTRRTTGALISTRWLAVVALLGFNSYTLAPANASQQGNTKTLTRAPLEPEPLYRAPRAEGAICQSDGASPFALECDRRAQPANALLQENQSALSPSADACEEAEEACRAWVKAWDHTPGHVAGGTDYLISMRMSPDGRRIYLTGYSTAQTGSWDMATVAYDIDGELLWTTRYNGPAEGNDYGQTIVVSPDGSTLWVSGVTASTRFGDGGNVVTVAYDAATGQQLWARIFDGGALDGYDHPDRMGLDPSAQSLYVAVESSGEKFEPDFVILAFDATSGAGKWFIRQDGRGKSYDFPKEVVVSRDGRQVYFLGNEGFEQGEAFAFDVRVSSFDTSTGCELWTTTFDTGGHDYAEDLLLDPNVDALYVTGATQRTGEAATDFTTFALDAGSGAGLWESRFSGEQNDTGIRLAMHRSGNRLIATGTFMKDLSYDWATAALNPRTGERLWTARRSIGELHNLEWGSSVELSPNGRVAYIGGLTRISQGVGRVNAADFTAVAYDTQDGRERWIARYNGSDAGLDVDDATSLALTPDGKRLVQAGTFAYLLEPTLQNASDYGMVAYDITGQGEESDDPPLIDGPPPPSPNGFSTSSSQPCEPAGPIPPPPPGSEPLPIVATHEDDGYINASNPTALVSGYSVTEVEFVLSGCAPPNSQGVDGYVFELPEDFGVDGGTVQVSGSTTVPYDLDMYFYTADCESVGGRFGPSPDEEGRFPEDTRFVVVNAVVGANTSVALDAAAFGAP